MTGRATVWGLAIVSTLATLMAMEVAVRVYRGRLFDFDQLIVESRDRWQTNWRSAYHPVLGWIPEIGASSRQHNLWGTDVTILADGIRSNGPDALAGRPAPILAVGDSFTFGDQVDDRDSWPAALERRLRQPVINAGVGAYGLDQIVLRAEELAASYEPSQVLVSFIADDIARTGVSARNEAQKPYFTIVAGRLELRNTPVPRPTEDLDRLRSLFGYSHLADALMQRAAPEYWLAGPLTIAHRRTGEVACLLMARLEALSQARGIGVMVIAQATWQDVSSDVTGPVLTCARERGLQTLDLVTELARYKREKPVPFAQLFQGHMTPRGNEYVAKQIARVLQSAARASQG